MGGQISVDSALITLSLPLNQDGLEAGKVARMREKQIKKFRQYVTFMAFSLCCSKILNSRICLENYLKM
jgi:hypothetical protein